MARTKRVSERELAPLLCEPDGSGALTPLQGCACLLVELDGGLAEGGDAGLAAALERLPCVSLGVANEMPPARRWHAALDALVLAGGAATERPGWVCDGDVGGPAAPTFLGAVLRNPYAALAQATLLRTTPAEGPTWSGLVAESAAYSTLLGGAEFERWRRDARIPRRDETDRAAVRVERQGDELRIVLDRPDRRNAFGRRSRDELVAALAVAAVEPAIARVELRGVGPSFCAGGDLAEFGDVGDPAHAHAVRIARHPGWSMDRVGPRVRVLVHGPCVGAGVELAAFAARVEADPGTRFRLPEVEMGLLPGAGGTVSVRRRIGRRRAAFLGISGAWLGAEAALRWGLVDAIAERPDS